MSQIFIGTFSYFLGQMLQKDPRARISLDDIQRHPFVSDAPTKMTLSSLQVRTCRNVDNPGFLPLPELSSIACDLIVNVGYYKDLVSCMPLASTAY